jgi:hypothetical protein
VIFEAVVFGSTKIHPKSAPAAAVVCVIDAAIAKVVNFLPQKVLAAPELVCDRSAT